MINTESIGIEKSNQTHYWLGLCWVLVILSSIAVVYVSHNSRQLFGQLESFKQDAADLQVEWGQLLLERSALTAHGRVESIAKEQLQMKVPTRDEMKVVTP